MILGPRLKLEISLKLPREDPPHMWSLPEQSEHHLEHFISLPPHALEHHREHHDLHAHHPQCPRVGSKIVAKQCSEASQPSAMMWGRTLAAWNATKQEIAHSSLGSARAARSPYSVSCGGSPWTIIGNSKGNLVVLRRPSQIIWKLPPSSSRVAFLV